GYIYAAQAAGTTALYRLFNPTSGDHFYTTSAAERDSAVASFGYQNEGIAGYVFASQAAGTTPLYRLLNTVNGDHFYTTSAAERDSDIAAAANERITPTVSDAANRATYTIDALGYVTQNVYDNVGHIIKTVTYARPIDFNNVVANPSAYGGDISGWSGAAAAVTAAQAGFGTDGSAIALTDRDTYGTD